jgi:hypothetical protein
MTSMRRFVLDPNDPDPVVPNIGRWPLSEEWPFRVDPPTAIYQLLGNGWYIFCLES